MKRLTLILAAVLLLPLTSEATIRKYIRGYSDFWCEDLPNVNPNDPNAIKGNCYAVAVTNWQDTSPRSPGSMIHQMRAAVSLRSPSGTTVHHETGLVSGIPKAQVKIAYKKWDGEYTAWFQVGEVYCPKGQMTQVAGLFSRRKRLGVSVICAKVDGNPPKPVYPIVGPQLGWNQGYFPIDPCNVKCKATHYTIHVVSPGGSVKPAPTGTIHKGFSVDVDTGEVTCSGFLVSFVPDGIPGIAPCASKGCMENIINIP